MSGVIEWFLIQYHVDERWIFRFRFIHEAWTIRRKWTDMSCWTRPLRAHTYIEVQRRSPICDQKQNTRVATRINGFVSFQVDGLNFKRNIIFTFWVCFINTGMTPLHFVVLIMFSDDYRELNECQLHCVDCKRSIHSQWMFYFIRYE